MVYARYFLYNAECTCENHRFQSRWYIIYGSSLLDYLTDPTTATEPLQSSAYSGERSGPHPYNEPHPKKLRLDMRYQLCTEGELESLSTGFMHHAYQVTSTHYLLSHNHIIHTIFTSQYASWGRERPVTVTWRRLCTCVVPQTLRRRSCSLTLLYALFFVCFF